MKLGRTNSVLLIITLKLSMFIDWLHDDWSPRSERWMFWTLLLGSLPVAYLMASVLCMLDSNSCLIANADLANWLFGK
jgi:hypothetical protein